jgi:hypothetical protein
MLAPLLLGLTFGAACYGTPPTPEDSRTQGVIQWEPIKRWSGRGDQQLDSFQSDSGALRIEWEAKRVPGASAPILEHRGKGKGTAYVSEEPRVFFMEVTSADVDWKIGVAERVR